MALFPRRYRSGALRGTGATGVGTRRRRKALAGLCASTTVAAIGLGSMAAGAAASPVMEPPATCGAVATGTVTLCQAAPDQYMNQLFDNYAQSGAGWTGADSTYSVPLSGGRDLWLFSDTFLGPIGPGTTRPTSAAFIHNSFVVQRGNQLSTVYGGTSALPTANVSPSNPDAWYWSGDGLVDGSTVQVIYLEFQKTGSGPFDFAWERDVVATFDERTLQLESVQPLTNTEPDMEWGSWLQFYQGYTYIYGTEDLGANKYMHIARVRGHNLLGTWQYYAGASGWSTSPTASVRVMDGVGNEFSVVPFDGRWLLVTQDTEQLFSSQVLGYEGTSPEGPFTGSAVLYTTPETGANGSYGNSNIFTYNYLVHPELSRGDSVVITYNVNSFDSNDLYKDTTIYRPRFVDVTLDLGSTDAHEGSSTAPTGTK